ncbi:MAG TPA: CHAT domain-containing protein [Vicinamibacterales bacterium]|nr:CHAT domain-containing protein [Vicinamibacterales bacterium]
MAIHTRPSGLTIESPDTYRLSDDARPRASSRGPGGRRTSGPVPMPAGATPPGAASEALLTALQKQDLVLIDQVELQPTLEATPRDGRRRAGAPAIPSTQHAEVTVTTAPDEDAVLLVEQEGVLSWHIDPMITPAPAVRSRGAGAGRRTARFTIEIGASRSPRPSARRGLLSDLVYDRVKVYALKFVARVAIGSGIKFLERKVRKGLIRVSGLDPAAWTLTSPADMALPANRPARVLLLVHGTFSSTIGSYGALAGTPWGQALLNAAFAHYDAVLGFDHATLSDDPTSNATELLAALEALDTPHPLHLDVVAFSRGGIVFRTLVEHLLPKSTAQVQVKRAVFVACTNAGTVLAEPENWHTLVDLYTNAAVAAFKLMTLLPQTTAAALILGELVQGLGAFVKHLATHATSDVPGLAAMRPDGEFITTLNRRQEGQPEAGAVSYFAITSEFKPVIIGGDHKPQELPARLVLALADGLVDDVMKEANDLVVNSASMTAIDSEIGTFVRDTFAFGQTPQVYHTTYFTRPEVTNALARWLQLPAAATREGMRARRTEQSGGAVAPLPPLALPRDVFVPVAADPDIAVVDARARVSDALRVIDEDAPSYVVVARQWGNQRLHYAFRPEEIEQLARHQPDVELGAALQLHETDKSDEQPVDAVHPPAAGGGPPSTRRAVVMANGVPVGVVHEQDAWTDLDIVELASRVAAPRTMEERAASRRAMPTFAASAAESLPLPQPLPQPRGREVTRSTRRRAPRGEPAGVAAPTPARPSQTVECHFLAEMNDEVIVQHVATVEVTVSREMLASRDGAASDTASSVEVEAGGKLIVQIVPKANFTLAVPGEDREEIDVPAPGEPTSLYFDLRAMHAGQGEVWVIIRQRQMGIAQLVLRPAIVERQRTAAPRRLRDRGAAAPAPPLQSPFDQLLIIEQPIGDSFQYHFELEMPSIGVFGWYTSKPLQVKRDDYVKQLYKGIEDRYLSVYSATTSKADTEAFTAELQAYGVTLFDELFPVEMQALLWTHRDQLKSIRVVSTEPFIPWEIVHLREPGKPLDPNARSLFLGQMGLVRWLHDAGGLPPAALRIRNGRARYVIPEYPHPDWQLPETVNERRYLERKFGARPLEPQPHAVRKALTIPGEIDLLHFACHGEADQDNITQARVVLEGRVEGNDFVPTHLDAATVKTFANLRGGDGIQPIVFLNACQAGRAGYNLTGIGGFAQAFLRGGAGAFVGTLWSVGDQPAFDFGKCFYDTLDSGANIATATSAARDAARSAGDATWLAYVVYGHPHAGLTR